MTALNSEGLEKARCATDGCGRPATQRFEAGGVGSDHCDDCAEKIRAARPALPPVDGLEVVAHAGHGPRYRQGGGTVMTCRSYDKQALEGAAEFFEQIATNANPAPLAFAQAIRRALEAAIDSAEIAGSLTENGNLWRFWSQKAQETAGKAEARISSLEEENKRLRAVVSASAAALSNGASILPDASLEFMEMLPLEIGKLCDTLELAETQLQRKIDLLETTVSFTRRWAIEKEGNGTSAEVRLSAIANHPGVKGFPKEEHNG